MEDAARIPVILDTDIGDDIDDTWALLMLMNSPELDVRLVTTSAGDTEYRAKIVAKFLEVAGRTDIPVGIGPRRGRTVKSQDAWVRDYSLSLTRCTILEHGVEALIDTIDGSPAPPTLITIGPLTNIAAALQRDPTIAAKTRFIGMQGCVRSNPLGRPISMAEHNVAMDIPAAREVFRATWRKGLVTPLDSCGQVVLAGDRYRRIRQAEDPKIRALMENYDLWCGERGLGDPANTSTVLFDTVAVYLAITTELLKMEHLPLEVGEDGVMRRSESGPEYDVALDWIDLDGFLDFLVDRLLGRT